MQGDHWAGLHRSCEWFLAGAIDELLGRLKFDDEALDWVRDALHASHVDERREHDEALHAETDAIDHVHHRPSHQL